MSSTARPRRVHLCGHLLEVDGPHVLCRGWSLSVHTAPKDGAVKYQAAAYYLRGRGLNVRSTKCWSPRAATRQLERHLHCLQAAIDDLVVH